jgi:cytochrome P450/CRP-like cAMP-binding protein
MADFQARAGVAISPLQTCNEELMDDGAIFDPLQPASSRLAVPSLPLPRPPRMPGLPFLGNNIDLMRDPEAFLINGLHEYGPVFRVRLGLENYTVLIGEEACRFFVKNGEKGFSRESFYQRFARELGCDYFILSEPQGGAKHSRLRRMMKLGFSRETAAAYVPRMVEAVRAAGASWAPGFCVPVMDMTARLTFQLYGFVMADRDIAPVYRDAKLYAQTIMMIGAKLMPTLALRMPGYRAAKASVFELMRLLIADARRRDRHSAPNLTILDALLQAYGGESSASEAEVGSAALYGFVGTMVYMNRVVSFLLYELAKNPASMERAAREADAAFAEGTPTAETLRRMVFLRAAFNESLRRHPVAIGLPFCVDEDFEFAGHQIQRGETVIISHVSEHFSTKYYRDPWKFDPERFMDPRSEHRTPGAVFAPFGFGGRACTAVGLVEVMVLTAVATLLHTVRFELTEPAYNLKTMVQPLVGPEERFRLRILGPRIPSAKTVALPPVEESMSGVLGDLAADPRIEALMERLEVREFPAGATIVRQGEESQHFFILVEGEVAVLTADAEGNESETARLGPAQYFGEAGLLSAADSPVTVRCLAATVHVLVMAREEFLSLVADMDLLSSDIALLARRRFLAKRLRDAIPQLSGGELSAYSDDLKLEKIDAGAVIVRQGDIAETFHIVTAGAVEVVVDTGEGERVLGRLGSGEYFGEMGLLLRRPRTATVRAGETGAEIMTMRRDAFEKMVGGSSSTRDEILFRIMGRVGGLLDAGVRQGERI